jgi:long-chain acyl-CoA synthetase
MLTRPRGSSLAVLAEAAQQRFGDQSSVVFEGATLTSGQLGAWARRFATGLAALGVGAGDRVAVCMVNCPEVLVAYQAIWRLGAAVTPLLFLLSEDELRHALRDSGATVVVSTTEVLPKVMAAARGLPLGCVVTGAGTGSAVSFEELSAGAEAGLTGTDPEDMAALLFTGGTTGRAKGVVLSHDALSSAAWSATLAGVEDELSVSLLPLPLAHVYGLMVATMSLHSVRASRSVLMRWFDPVGWLRLAQDHGVQIGTLVPTMLRLLAAQPLESYDLTRLQRLVSGSAPLPAEVADEWCRRVPHVEVVEGYGCSETAALATTTRRGRARAGSVGQAAPGVALRIELPGGAAAAAGVSGEVCIRTPSLMTGYWHDPDATASAVRDGWLHTGDIGRLDDDGYLFILDRLKDVIIRDGFNVHPRDVEESLTRHPAVAACAVVGRPDREHGEEVVAFVQLNPGASVSCDDLVEFARAHLSAVKYPREVHILDQVPLTSIGKLDRLALRMRL